MESESKEQVAGEELPAFLISRRSLLSSVACLMATSPFVFWSQRARAVYNLGAFWKKKKNASSDFYVDDVFSTYIYTGNGSTLQIRNGIKLADSKVTTVFSTDLYVGNGGTQMISNGIDLASGGGLVWIKNRSGINNHVLVDTSRGMTSASAGSLASNTNGQQNLAQNFLMAGTSGFSLGTNSNPIPNALSNSYVAWTFRKAPKFFDIVTWTGDGALTRTISHNLGIAPGMILVKNVSSAGSWWVHHRSLSVANNYYLLLDTTQAQANAGGDVWGATATSFNAHNGLPTNTLGHTYVAYLFAHDAASDGMIQCGSYTGTGSATGPAIDLGWQPQWLLIKNATSAGWNWLVYDTARGLGTGNDALLVPNTSAAENTSSNYVDLTATGFWVVSSSQEVNESGSKFVYLAIRASETTSSAGGLVWLKGRSASGSHRLLDTTRGAGQALSTNSIAMPATGDLGSFRSSGYVINNNLGDVNTNGGTYVSWTFRRSAKFFDIVTYTGNGVPGRAIPHSLGISPGMIIVRRTDGGGPWAVLHTSLSATKGIEFQAANAPFTDSTYWANTNPTSTQFSVGNNGNVNGTGGQYIAYLFAHDPSAGGIIQCGSYMGNGSTSGPMVDLGWEPQYLLIKNATADGTSWRIYDSMRGITDTSVDPVLYANLTNAENTADNGIRVMPTGFQPVSNSTEINSNSAIYVYLAIRRPNKVPSSGTEVFFPYAMTGAELTTLGSPFVPDAMFFSCVSGTYGPPNYTNYVNELGTRLTGMPQSGISGLSSAYLRTNSWQQESASGSSYIITTSDGRNATAFSGWSSTKAVWYLFRRAPKFLDIVCFTGTQLTPTSFSHSLAVTPELMILKNRSGSGNDWIVYGSTLTSGKYLRLNTDAAENNLSGNMFPSNPTATQFTVTDQGSVNYGTMIAYLFATCPGVSKVGSFTGSASDVVVPCGFTGSARFVLVKRTDAVGDWIVVDSARGSSFYLTLNTANAETSATVITFTAGGFTAKAGTVANAAAGASYIFLAIA